MEKIRDSINGYDEPLKRLLRCRGKKMIVYTENYKTLMEKIKDINKCKYILWSWIGRLNIVNITRLLKTIYRFNEVPIKILKIIFTEIGKKTIL